MFDNDRTANEVIQAALEEYKKLCLWRAENLDGDEDDPHKWERHAEIAGDLIGSFD